MSKKYKEITEELLKFAGIQINGSKPWDIRIHDERFYKRVMADGELGLGESYMDAWWDVEKLDEFIYLILHSKLNDLIRHQFRILLRLFMVKLFNHQSKSRAFIIGEKHYNLGNDLFQNMLDKRMNYSCAYWKDADNLDQAQENKLELICNKLMLKPGMRVLDIGCGWGAFGKYAAEKYKVEVIGITVSKEQVELGRKLCEGLPVEFRLLDYRDMNEKFDRIVSIGMIEHVGYRNYRTFFKTANKCMEEDGLFLLHTIGSPKSLKTINPWTDRYIFPNGMLPSVAQLSKAIENLFLIEDLHNIGNDYDRTLMAWHQNFIQHWDQIKSPYSERFFRMWNYYLLSSAGAFRARVNQVWQIVLSKNGMPGGYPSIR